MRPEHVEEFITGFTAEWNRLQGAIEADNMARGRQLETVTRKLDQLIEAICDGVRAPGLQQKLDELEARKASLLQQMRDQPPPVPRMHPNLAGVYRERVEHLQAALAAPDGGTGALEAVRTLIDRIDIGTAPAVSGHLSRTSPTDRNAKAFPDIVLTGAIASMIELALGGDLVGRQQKAARAGAAGSDLFSRSVKVVAGRGFEPLTFRL